MFEPLLDTCEHLIKIYVPLLNIYEPLIKMQPPLFKICGSLFKMYVLKVVNSAFNVCLNMVDCFEVVLLSPTFTVI